MSLPQIVISMLLFIVLFFGIGFLLNMILRATWVMAVIYPIIVIFIVDEVKAYQYFTSPFVSLQALFDNITGLKAVDMLILTAGFGGAILAGVVIKMLRARGYRMF